MWIIVFFSYEREAILLYTIGPIPPEIENTCKGCKGAMPTSSGSSCSTVLGTYYDKRGHGS